MTEKKKASADVRIASTWAADGTTSTHRFDRAELPIVRYAADL